MIYIVQQEQWLKSGLIEKRKVNKPVLTSYIFANINSLDRQEMLKNRGVASSVFWLNQPLKIKDYEIKAIRDFLDDYPNVKLEFLNLQYGQKVEIPESPLRGEEDILVKKKTNKVIAEISSMNFSLQAEISVLNVQKI